MTDCIMFLYFIMKEDIYMKSKENSCHITSIGGQAVIEGVMMRGPKETATAVRKSDGSIIIEKKPVSSFVSKYKLNKIPIVRGVFNFVDSLVTGMKCIMFSADQMDLEEGEDYKPSKFEAWLEEKLGDKIKDIAIYVSAKKYKNCRSYPNKKINSLFVIRFHSQSFSFFLLSPVLPYPK